VIGFYSAGAMGQGGAPTPGGFPVFLGVTITPVNPSTATSHPINMPATVNAGDLLIVIFAADGSGTSGDPAGWTSLGTANAGTATALGRWAYLVADGSEAGGTAAFTTSTAERSSGLCVRIQAGTYTGAPEMATLTTGTSLSPDPPNLTPSGGPADYLWLASYVQESLPSSAPTYPLPNGNAVSETGTSNSNIATCACCYTLQSGSSLDPGAFGIPGTTVRPWIASTIAVKGV